MKNNKKIFSKEYTLDSETEGSTEKRDESTHGLIEKEYISDNKTKGTAEKEGVINKLEGEIYESKSKTEVTEEKEKPNVNKILEDAIKRYGLAKPKRVKIRGKITHD